MGKLGDILGDDFEEEYENKRREVEEQRRKVSQETMMEICYEAVEGGGFDGEEPRFTFDAGEVDHDVVLMESPQNDLHKFRHEFEQSGGVSLGMFHMGDLWSCVFNEDMVAMVDKIEEDEYYVVVGRYQENIQNAGTEDEEKYINISPVRGIVPIEVAKEYAEKYDSAMSGSDKQSQAQQQNQQVESDTDESSEDEDDSDVDLGGIEDDDGQVDRDKVVEVFHAIGNDAPQVLKDTAAGDSDAIDKLVKVTNQNLDQEAERERILDIFEDEVEEIEGRGEDEDEEDDGVDLGGLGDDDEDEDEEEEEESEPEPEPEEEEETDESEDSGGDDDGEGVDDWF